MGKKRTPYSTSQAIHTILAALRFYQSEGQGNPNNRSDDIHEIATNCGDNISLDAEAIDQLCIDLNTGVLEIAKSTQDE